MHDRLEIAPGVFRHARGNHAVYSGAADALISAGIVARCMLPGQPGNGRGMVSFHADGSRLKAGRPNGSDVGRKSIVAKLDGSYEVRVTLSPERLEALDAARVRASAGWPFPVHVAYGAELSAMLLDRQTVGQGQGVFA